MNAAIPLSITVGTGVFPIPSSTRGLKKRGDTGYPFDTLAVNGWFRVHARTGSAVRQAIRRYYRNNGGARRFITRSDGGDQIVWRVK